MIFNVPDCQSFILTKSRSGDRIKPWSVASITNVTEGDSSCVDVAEHQRSALIRKSNGISLTRNLARGILTLLLKPRGVWQVTFSPFSVWGGRPEKRRSLTCCSGLALSWTTSDVGWQSKSALTKGESVDATTLHHRS